MPKKQVGSAFEETLFWLKKLGELQSEMRSFWPKKRGKVRGWFRSVAVFDAKHFWLKKKLFLIAGPMVVMGLVGILFLYTPLVVAEVRYRLGWVPQVETIEERQESQEKVVDPKLNFFVSIPKIGAQSVVVANVNTSDRKAYGEALKNGVAHAIGSGLPGMESEINRTVVLFAHSTDSPLNFARYNAVFYLLNDLEKGDKVEVYFNQKPYLYRVVQTKVVAASDISYFAPQTREEVLVLQTCYPPGTTWKRFLVIAKPVGTFASLLDE